ncbi:MAG TPA: SigE family RNA polymerase sigma factor [Micromonosporaceae bacterium]|nr:SigE family RNA polymerase sigma factor [Micromonosporaceae bacterium]
MNPDEEEFRRFVAARLEMLRGLAYLTCGDWQIAEDVVSTCLAKLYVRWGSVSSPERYVTRMVVRAVVDEARRPWRREWSASHALPEVIEPDVSDRITEAMRVRQALHQLPPGQRTVLVLRFYADFSVEETAEVLGRSPGTISSQTARGLATLRRLLAAEDIALVEELEERDDDARCARNLVDG